MKKISVFPLTLVWYPNEYTDPNANASDFKDITSIHSGSWASVYGLSDSIVVANANEWEPWYVPTGQEDPPVQEDDEDLPDNPLAIIEADPLTARSQAAAQTKGKGKSTHKRGISEAIPRADRENGASEDADDEPTRTNAPGKGKSDNGKGKSRAGRQLKPKKR
jgi:hypothetical protein